VLDFEGDIKASAAGKLTQEINALLTIATSDDEVVINLESMGGMVHAYGLAASQLKRITDQSIPLTVCVDKVAASGGYMMACIADKILAAPFAIIGSIGVMAEVPNFHRLLKKHDVDFEVLTAGEHKRTLTMFGQNTDKGREKFMEELQETHDLFKSFISENRPQVNIDQVATGEVWYGSKALENNLVDGVQTLDAYLMANRNDAEIYEVAFVEKKSLQEKLGLAAHTALDKTLLRWWERAQHNRFI
jgi:serine protease SohB